MLINTYTNTCVYERHPLEQGGCSSEIRADVLSGKKFVAERAASHRACPTIPVLNPTSQTEASRTTIRYSRWANKWNQRLWCDGKYINHEITQRKYVAVAGEQISIAPPLKWYYYDLFSNIQSQQVDLAASLANYNKIAGMFIDFAKLAADVFRCFSRGRCSNLYNRTKHPLKVTGTMFYVDFGIKPLVGTMKSAADEFNEANYNKLHRFTTTYKDSIQRYSSAYHSDTKVDLTEKLIAYYILNPTSGPISIGDPARWSWEAIPFSFVIDWFIPIGSLLANVGMSSRLSSLTATLTRKQKRRSTPVFGEQTGWHIVTGGSTTYESHSRVIVAPHYDPLAFLGSYKAHPSASRVAHALGLLYQLRYGR